MGQQEDARRDRAGTVCMSAELTLLLTLGSMAVAIYAAYSSSKKNSSEYIDRKVKWETDQERRLAKLEQDLARMTPVNDRVVALETQMAPLWRIVEDSILKSLIHNPLTLEEREALEEFYRNKRNPRWFNRQALEIGKKGLQRELKELEDDNSATPESTVPYVLTIAAIDRRLAGAGPA